jgi:CHASE1-domain containing sensor protein
LAILKQYWEGKDTGDIGYRVYSDEEEREAAINFLKNRAVTSEEPFTVVVSKAKKKNMQKGFQVHNTRSRGRHPD